MTPKLKRLPPGEALTPAHFNLLVDALNGLAAQPGGAQAMAQTPAGAVTAPLEPPILELVELADDVASYELDKTAHRLKFDPDADEAERFSPDDDDRDESLSDWQASLYLAGERRLCYFSPVAGRLLPADAFQWHIGRLDEDLPHEGVAPVSIWRHDAVEGTFADSQLDVVAHDWLLEAGRLLPAGSRVVLLQLAHSRRWIVVATDTCPEPQGS